MKQVIYIGIGAFGYGLFYDKKGEQILIGDYYNSFNLAHEALKRIQYAKS